MERIAILGASENQLPLIIKAKELGYETHVFAWKCGDVGEYEADYFYPISIYDRNVIFNECSRLHISGIVTISSDLGMFTVAQIAKSMNLPCHDLVGVTNCINKIKTREILKQNNIKCVNDCYSIDKLKYCNFDFPLVVKPCDRSGLKGISIIENKDDLVKAINLARDFSFENKEIIEKFMNCDFYSAECISANGKHRIIAITKNIYKVENKKFVPSFFYQKKIFNINILMNIEKEIYNILDIFKLNNGATNIEFFLTENMEMIVNEVSPCVRGEFVGSHLMKHSCNFDYIKSVINISCGKSIDINDFKLVKDAHISFNVKEKSKIIETIGERAFVAED